MRSVTRKHGAAALALMLAFGLLLAWDGMADRRARSRQGKIDAAIAKRELHVSAAELASLMRDRQVALALFDLREESAYNRFHLLDAERLVLDAAAVERLRTLPEQSVKLLIADDERAAERASRTLLLAGAKQVYLLAGGIGSWYGLFPEHRKRLLAGAFGGRHPLSEPGDDFKAPASTRKVQLSTGRKSGPGGCGG